MLKLSKGNAKLGSATLIFNLPAGRTCPGAMFCKSQAVMTFEGRKIQDSVHTEFRCFAASAEVQYDAVYASRAENLQTVRDHLNAGGPQQLADALMVAINHYRTKNTQLVRIHESGDFFNQDYLNAWLKVASMMPELKFYCYSKSLHLFLEDNYETLQAELIRMPENFYMTASHGGRWDHLITRNYFPRYAKVFMYEHEAAAEGLEVDHDDSHCFGDKPFALLVHGTQPKGSDWGKAIRDRRKQKQFAGYSK